MSHEFDSLAFEAVVKPAIFAETLLCLAGADKKKGAGMHNNAFILDRPRRNGQPCCLARFLIAPLPDYTWHQRTPHGLMWSACRYAPTCEGLG